MCLKPQSNTPPTYFPHTSYMPVSKIHTRTHTHKNFCPSSHRFTQMHALLIHTCTHTETRSMVTHTQTHIKENLANGKSFFFFFQNRRNVPRLQVVSDCACSSHMSSVKLQPLLSLCPPAIPAEISGHPVLVWTGGSGLYHSTISSLLL